MAQHRPGTAVPRKPSPAVYRRRRLAAAIILLVLIGLLVAAGFFIASLFGSATTEGQAQAGTDQAAVQGQKSETRSDGQDKSAGKGKAGNDKADNGKTGKDKKAGNDDGGSGDGGQAGGDAGKQEAKEAEGKEETAEEEPSPEATEPASCEDSDVVVKASTDQTVYPQGTNPVLTMSVSNEGDDKCTINLGTSQMEFLITSGEDRIFSSADCQVDAVDNKQTLKSGETEKAKLTWERNRTAPDCAPVEAEPLAGTYTLVTKLGERTSEEVTFRLE